jgi:hypothetical protein
MTIDDTVPPAARGGSIVTRSQQRDLSAQDGPRLPGDGEIIDLRPIESPTSKKRWAGRKGVIFRQVVPEKFIADPYTEERAMVESRHARLFFGVDISPTPNPWRLYEGIEADFVRESFDADDERFFETLSEFRRTINGNVLRLSVLLSAITTVMAFVSAVTSGLIRVSVPLVFLGVDMQRLGPPKAVAAEVISAAVALTAVGLIYLWPYSNAQRLNGQKLSNFLTRYFTAINSDFSVIQRNASQAISNERDTKEMQQKTKLWWTVLLWTSQRQFFLECYLRNVAFQIRRNGIAYVVSLPLVAASLSGIVLLVAMHEGIASLGGSDFRLGFFQLLPVVILIASVSCLAGALSFVQESLRNREWQTLRHLDVIGGVTEILRGYVNQLELWQTANNSGRK